jgi:hypothetical protein
VAQNDVPENHDAHGGKAEHEDELDELEIPINN